MRDKFFGRLIFVIITLIIFQLFVSFSPSSINKGEENVIDKSSRGTRKVIELSEEDELWVNKTLESMTLYDKCAQIFMPAVFGKTLDQQSKEFRFALEMVKLHGIGGIVISTGNVEETASMIAELQKNSKIPLLVSADFENGIGMRMKASNTFPHNMALGSTYNPDFAYQTGKATAIEALMLGVNINLAPVADVNNNPGNPVINLRSYSEDKDVVTEFCLSFVNGSLEAGVIPIAKHFPGHGNTKTDSHIDLPVISGNKETLMNNELKPFISLIENKVPAIMSGHLNVPAFDNNKKIPASLSYKIITKLLKEQLDYKGLIITDALDMKAVTNYYSNAEACIMAFNAGNDILLMPLNSREGITAIYEAVKSGKITKERLNESVKKILTLKRWLKLDVKDYKQKTVLPKRIRLEEHYQLAKTIAENSVTIVKADKELLPIDSSKYLKMFIIDITNRKNIKDAHFSQIIHESFSVYSHTLLTNESVSSDYKLALDIAKDSDFIIVPAYFYIRSGVNGKTVSDIQYNFFQDLLALNKKVLIISFESPYLLSNFPDAENYICTFSDSKASQRAVLNVLNGTLSAKGKLPVSIPNTEFSVGYSWNVQ
ncbi:MAG: glycoside hydrolase family 3 protein [Ignavibacterium sp.]|jgi:beta-glucosidase-like glycosyl hydrolase|nr:glycoside hydrolase family 3 protein [Ignavibacterium sp.]